MILKLENHHLTRSLDGIRNKLKNRKIDFLLTEEEFFLLTQKSCFYCGRKKVNSYKRSNAKNNISFAYNGVDRIDSKKVMKNQIVFHVVKYAML